MLTEHEIVTNYDFEIFARLGKRIYGRLTPVTSYAGIYQSAMRAVHQVDSEIMSKTARNRTIGKQRP